MNITFKLPHGASMALMSLALIACSDGNSLSTGARVPAAVEPSVEPLPPAPSECPAEADLISSSPPLLDELVIDQAMMERWQRYMVALGPRFTGSRALKRWHDFLAHQLSGIGLDVQREPVPINWWAHKRWSLELIVGGEVTSYPVASYFPYSGQTPPQGIQAEVVDAGQGLPTDFLVSRPDGKIAFFEVDLLPLTMALFYANASYVHDPRMTMTPLTDYRRMSLSIITPQLSILPPEQTTSLYNAREQGAVGAIISLDASAENAAGQYTPFHHHPDGSFQVPTLYVDRATGDEIKAQLAPGVQARLVLEVDEHPDDSTDDIIATLPGQSDEVVIVNTHTDGTSASEENGAIASLAIARYFASLPVKCRQRTLVFVFSPGHFHGGLSDIARFIENHPEIISRSVASVTPEHLGQEEWLDGNEGLQASGEVEPGVFFGSASPLVQLIMTNAVMAENLERTIVSRPIAGVAVYFGLGADLNTHGVPNAAYLTGPNMLYSSAENQHLDKVDYARMEAETRTLLRVTQAFDRAETALLCAGTPPSQDPQHSACAGILLGE